MRIERKVAIEVAEEREGKKERKEEELVRCNSHTASPKLVSRSALNSGM